MLTRIVIVSSIASLLSVVQSKTFVFETRPADQVNEMTFQSGVQNLFGEHQITYQNTMGWEQLNQPDTVTITCRSDPLGKIEFGSHNAYYEGWKWNCDYELNPTLLKPDNFPPYSTLGVHYQTAPHRYHIHCRTWEREMVTGGCSVKVSIIPGPGHGEYAWLQREIDILVNKVLFWGGIGLVLVLCLIIVWYVKSEPESKTQ